MKKTSQRSLLFRQNVNRTEAEWVHFLDGYRKALIEFDMNKFGDDWHTAEDIVEEIFLNIVREPRITALRPQDSFRHVLINMCMQKHKSFTKPWRRRLAEKLCVALSLSLRTQDETRREIAAGFLDLVLADMADAARDGGRHRSRHRQQDPALAFRIFVLRNAKMNGKRMSLWSFYGVYIV